jgi:hypothetical protein
MESSDWPERGKPDWDTAQRLAELIISLGKKGTAVYIDVYPVDPARPDEYTYEYTETRIEGSGE